LNARAVGINHQDELIHSYEDGRAVVLTRRQFHIYSIGLGTTSFALVARGQTDEMVTVRIRADDAARSVLPPIEQKNLTIEQDNSEAAKELAERVPPGRALPILVIIAGAIAVTELLKMIQELYRQTYYGGVVIDTRLQPPMISSDPRIPGNMVFAIDAEGNTTQYTSDQFSLDALKLALKVK
jgi:hypothetical protein